MISREIWDWHRTRVWALRIAEFGSVQAIVQLLNGIAGLLVVRSLTKEDYALFAIFNSMQTACHTLAELGTGMGFQSIGGRVYGDRNRFGALLNVILGLRRQFALVSFGICTPIAAWLLWKNGAETWVVIALCTAMLIGAAPMVVVSLLLMVPQLHGEYRRIQSLQMGGAVLRCLLIGALAVTWMSAVLAALVGALVNWIQLVFLRRWAREHADPLAPPNADDRREILRLSVRSLPNALFFCIQGQVTLLILTFLGSPTAIADITALGRLAMLLAVFSAVFSNVLIPRFARCQDPARLPWLYLSLVGATVAILAPFAVASWFFPEPLLWLLGSKYASLGMECGWVVTAGCLGQVAGVMWGLNASKAWFRVQAIWYIPALICAQIVAALCLDLRRFNDVLIFNLVAAAAPLPLYVFDAWLGFAAARRDK